MRSRTAGHDTSPVLGSGGADLARLLGLSPPAPRRRLRRQSRSATTASSWLLSGIPLATLGLGIVLTAVLVISLLPSAS
jgi:hypothetical protein